MNLLNGITPGSMQGLKWMNEPVTWATSGGGIIVRPRDYADFFVDPAGRHMKSDAPLLYLDVEGDFVARALVKPAFHSVWDSAVLMVHAGENSWGKLCFEWCDAGRGYKGIVSVVTKGTSDDANGQPLEAEEVWLQICRVGALFVMHWSLDGDNWSMARLFGLNCGDSVRVGIAAQCPGGSSVAHEFKFFSVESTTVGDMRKGV